MVRKKMDDKKLNKNSPTIGAGGGGPVQSGGGSHNTNENLGGNNEGTPKEIPEGSLREIQKKGEKKGSQKRGNTKN